MIYQYYFFKFKFWINNLNRLHMSPRQYFGHACTILLLKPEPTQHTVH